MTIKDQILNFFSNIFGKASYISVPTTRQTETEDTSYYFRKSSPDYDYELARAIKVLVMYNHDFGQALNTVVELGNTTQTVTFPDISNTQANKLLTILKEARKNWYKTNSGIDSMRGDMIAQLVIYGACAVETVPKKNLSGIEKVILIDPTTVEFEQSADGLNWLPYQFTSRGRKELNTTTFKYYAVRTLSEKPYGVPPFLTALESMGIEKSMMDNVKKVVENIGVIGFLEILVKAPLTPQNINGRKETEIEIQKRLNNIIQLTAVEAQKGMKQGFMVGVAGQNEFKMNSATRSVTGAAELIQINTEQKAAGLKTSPFILGRNYSTTESLGSVILEIMASSINTYQLVIDQIFKDCYELELLLQGKPTAVEVVSEKPLIKDRVKEEQAYSLKLNNLSLLYEQGIIDQTQFAQEAGYDKPAIKEPAVRETKKQEPTNTDNEEEQSNNKDVSSLFKTHCTCNNHDNHDIQTFAKNPFDPYLIGYSEATKKNFKKALKASMELVYKYLEGIGENQFIDAEKMAIRLLSIIYIKWEENFGIAQIKITTRWIESSYNYFRRSQDALKGLKDIPSAVFNTRDYRTIAFSQRHDNFYLGKFITDESTQRKVNQFIKDEYVGNEFWYKDKKQVAKFTEVFGELLGLEQWKIDGILTTTMNRLRNWGAVNYMHQAEVENYIIRGVNDRLQCPFCAGMQGKVFAVAKTVEKIDATLKTSVDNVKETSPFLTSVFDTKGMNDTEITDYIKGKSSVDLQKQGIDSPPYHPRCRDLVVAEL